MLCVGMSSFFGGSPLEEGKAPSRGNSSETHRSPGHSFVRIRTPSWKEGLLAEKILGLHFPRGLSGEDRVGMASSA
jgi:hypothetical protein